MKNFFKLIFVVFVFFFLFCSNNITFAESRFNIEEKDILTKEYFLKGNWDFYWNKLLSSNDLKYYQPDDSVEAPFRWASNKKYNLNGCATYKTIINVPSDGIYTFNIPNLEHSYKIYANGILVAEDGNVSCNIDNYKPGKTSQMVSVLSKNKQIELIVQISSFKDLFAGMQSAIGIGNQNVVLRNRETSIAFNCSILAIIFIMAIYHLIIFMMRKKDISFLIFFFLSLTLSIRLIFAGFMAQWLFPGVSYDLTMRLTFLPIVLAPMLLVMFTRYLFYPEKEKSNMLRVTVAYSVPVSLFMIFFPVEIFAKLLYVYQVGVVVVPLFAFYHLIRAVVYKKDGALILLGGTVILFLFAINDILYTNVMFNTGFLTPCGLVIFILCQSFVLAKKYNKISELYIKDPLTNIYNKRYLLDYLKDSIHFCKKNVNKKFSIAVLDIDHFKNINDSYGHDFGDHALKCLAENISESIRRYDVFARYGGEEFVIIFEDLSAKDSYLVCDRIRQKISELEIIGSDKSNKNINIKLTISIGLSDYIREKHLNYNQLIKSADSCLYEAKNFGRNRVVANFDN